jgi:pyruvate,water dikinase
MGVKDQKMVYGDDPGERVKTIAVDAASQRKFCLGDAAILQLARWVMLIENYYSIQNNRWCPMDVEWALDGLTKELFIVQARPETVFSQRKETGLKEYRLKPHNAAVVLTGTAVGDKIGSGPARLMYSLDKRVMDGNEFREGDVLVTDMTDPDWEPIMKKAAAIITNKGGRTCHAAIVAREMGVPAIVGTGMGTRKIKDGDPVTACCAEGATGTVYEGILDYELIETALEDLPPTRTALMLNLASPDRAFHYAHLPHRGVGLARVEFIINHSIGIHPMALLTYMALGDDALAAAIEEKIAGFQSAEDFFVSTLAFGIARIAAAVYPHPCIVRYSDFKSNEYYNLPGGKYFEPQEENPMIGWRGASRYYSSAYREAFGLECQAIKRAREEMGLTNIVVMIPFCRTVEELLKVKEVMKANGLQGGRRNWNCT